MGQVDEAISTMFRDMERIDRVVQAIMDEEAQTDLAALGAGIGRALAIWNSEGNHAPGWLAKKAYDSIMSIVGKSLVAEMNEQLGLPEDYRG